LLPTEIWVADEHAYAIATNEFRTVPVTLVGNPFLADIESEIAGSELARRAGRGVNVLYIGEIIDEFSAARPAGLPPYNYTEQDALRYFMDNISFVFDTVNSVTVRPHPAEPKDKYDWAMAEYGAVVTRSSNADLLDDIRECDVVVGCETMAMVVGLVAGKRVICSVPPGGKPCALPHPEIEQLQTILSRRALS
jgi:hypothetical protein